MTVSESSSNAIESYTDGGPYTLDKLVLPDAHVYHGREFPVAYRLNLKGKEYDQSRVESLLETFSKSGTFTKLIEDHGVVVLRDTIIDSDDSKADEAAKFIQLIESNRGHEEFKQNGTLGLREKKGHNLYVASKSPPESRLLQHNEFSRFKKFPTTLIFTILDYTATGGDTPLVHGGELFERVQKELPAFLEKLSKHGLTYSDDVWPKNPRVEGGVIWNHEVTFGRDIEPEDDLDTQKLKVENIAKEYVSSDFRWDENDDLVIQFNNTKPVRKFKGEPWLFSSLANFSLKQVNDPSKIKVKYGNGDLFDEDDLAKYREIVFDLEYRHHWKSGDLVFLHNYQVSHGKIPYKTDGKRVTFVGMWDEKKERIINEFKPYDLIEDDHSITTAVEALSI